MGDHWSVVRTIPGVAEKSGLSVQIWICSAGYGLIRPETPIKAYRATFARGEDDYIASGLVEGEHTLHNWWNGVCSFRFSRQKRAPRTISEIAAAFPRTPVVVALSADYLKAVTQDLAGLLARSYFRDHLSIVSCGTPQTHPIWRHNLLPCDGSLACSLGGTLTSLNARVARRLFQSVNDNELTVESLAELASAIDRGVRGIAPSRITQADSDVARFIRAQLAKFPATSKTKLLREFRGEGHACEQKRFGEIYSRVRHDPLPGLNA
jgi:hypothetical protein